MGRPDAAAPPLRVWLDYNSPRTCFLLGVALSGGDVLAAAETMVCGGAEST